MGISPGTSWMVSCRGGKKRKLPGAEGLEGEARVASWCSIACTGMGAMKYNGNANSKDPTCTSALAIMRVLLLLRN